MTKHKRSKRQLYIGVFFIAAAIIAALLRSIGPSSPANSFEFTRLDDLIGISTEQAADRLGEPTARLMFDPAEDSNPLRTQVADQLSKTGRQVPETILELTWFDGDAVITIWFVAADSGEQATYRSIDSVRYTRQTAEQPNEPSTD